MRQPVCVGCDGRELLTLNSVTAPLTESHLNAHKRSRKYLRNTRSFRGGSGAGVSRGNPAKAEVSIPRRNGAKPRNLDNVVTKGASPPWCRASPPARPSFFHRNTLSEGTQTVSDYWLSNGFISLKLNASLCAK